MSSDNPRTVAQSPSFLVSPWHLSAADRLAALRSEAAVIGLGESAHFVSEFNHLRADVLQHLRRGAAITHLALEVGSDEAPAIQAWLEGRATGDLQDVVGPLTYCLYGTFLMMLRETLGAAEGLVVLGVDLPNSLTLEPSLAPLSRLLEHLDGDTRAQVDRARSIAAAVQGGSAAASAFSWMDLDPTVQDALTVHLSRLWARVDMLAALAEAGGPLDDWSRARRLVDAARATDLMLRAMAELFTGTGRPADTTVRERFIAGRLCDAVDALGPGEAIVYVAHNNHIQKAPVVFDDVVAAFPVGQFLARRLGRRYRAIALSHLGGEVPEMVFPASTDVGFRVQPTPADGIAPAGIEAAAEGAGDVLLVEPRREDGDALTSIRSQSAMTVVPVTAFDATLVVPWATRDPLVKRLVIRGGGHQEPAE